MLTIEKWVNFVHKCPVLLSSALWSIIALTQGPNQRIREDLQYLSS